MIETMRAFIQTAESLDYTGSIDWMYDVFENDTSDELRGMIYSLASPDSCEPFRSAMINLGFPEY